MLRILFSLIVPLRPLLFRLILAFLLILLSVFCSFLMPYLFKVSIDTLARKDDFSASFITVVVSGYGGCWIINHLLVQARGVALYNLVERYKKLLSAAVVDTLLSLTMSFHAEKKTGTLTNVLERAQRASENVFWAVLAFLVPAALEFLFLFYVMSVSHSMIFGIIASGAIVLYALLNYSSVTAMTLLQEEHNKANSDVSSELVDVLLNIEAVKNFSREYYEKERIKKLLEKRELCATAHWQHESWVQMKHMFILGATTVVITTYAGHAVYIGSMSIGTFVLINSYLLQFTASLNNVGYVIHQLRKGVEDLRAVALLLQQEPSIKDPLRPCSVDLKEPIVAFHNVSFGYLPEHRILKGISFTVHTGKTIAFVGPSGSGKSTIGKLLLRLYDPCSGSITVNGTDIRSIKQSQLRDAIGTVPQTITLFHTSLYNNIAYGNPSASAQDVGDAAEKAQLHGLVTSLPQGYSSIVGEHGLKLSGGERQRIGIARVLLKKPRMYLFDEATSSLDSATEQNIQKSIRDAIGNATTIIIAHRLSTVMHADHIIVLSQGHIVEEGTHETLLQKNTLYAELWSKQQHHMVDTTTHHWPSNHFNTEDIFKV